MCDKIIILYYTVHMHIVMTYMAFWQEFDESVHVCCIQTCEL